MPQKLKQKQLFYEPSTTSHNSLFLPFSDLVWNMKHSILCISLDSLYIFGSGL